MSGWKLTVRHGSEVSREQFSDLGEAVAAAEKIAAEITAEGDLRDVSLLRDFTDVQIRFAVGRYVRYNPRLMGRVQVFTARKPGA